MATAPPPDAIDRTEAFAAIAKQAAERATVGQNAPVPGLNGLGGTFTYPPVVFDAGGGFLAGSPAAEKSNALLPDGSVRLSGQEYKWATLSDGTGAWVVVVA